MKLMLSILLTVWSLVVWAATTDQTNGEVATVPLYAGEQLLDANGFPSLVRFYPGRPERPLVIFVPGDSHLARIAYGSCKRCRDEDFLAHWLQRSGYSFLGVSYPLGRSVYPTEHPEYELRDWGRQVVTIASEMNKLHKLNGKVIILGWSMGGKILQSVFSAAEKSGLKIKFFVSLSATPPLPGLAPGVMNGSVESQWGLADNSDKYNAWINQLEHQNKLNGHILIPKTIYLSEFLGLVPVDIMGTSTRYVNKTSKWEQNPSANIVDLGAFQFDEMPLAANLHGTSSLDSNHVLTDDATWNFYRATVLYQALAAENKLAQLSHTRWKVLRSLFADLGPSLSGTIEGDHFFFVGEIGARATARYIEEFDEKVDKLRAAIRDILGAT